MERPYFLEHLVGSDDHEVHVRIVARIALGDGAPDDQSTEFRVVALSVGQAIDGSLVVVANICSITAAPEPARFWPPMRRSNGAHPFGRSTLEVPGQ